MAFQTFTPTELVSLAENEKNVTVYQGQGAAIRYLVMNVQRPPFNNIAVRKAMAYLMPRQSIASRVYRGDGQAALLDAACRAARATSTRSPRSTAVRRASRRRRRCCKAAGVTTPVPIELWWTPTHYGDASADEYAEIKRGSRAGAACSRSR